MAFSPFSLPSGIENNFLSGFTNTSNSFIGGADPRYAIRQALQLGVDQSAISVLGNAGISSIGLTSDNLLGNSDPNPSFYSQSFELSNRIAGNILSPFSSTETNNLLSSTGLLDNIGLSHLYSPSFPNSINSIAMPVQTKLEGLLDNLTNLINEVEK